MTDQNIHTYFQKLNTTLQNYKRAIPSLLIDLDKLDQNIATLKQSLPPETSYRIVAKSLPSIDLIQYVMKKANTAKLMVFHQPFLTHITTICNHQADILIGKPLPIKTAQYFYSNLPENALGFNPYSQIQWLVDTPLRIQQYIDLAKSLNQKLQLNLELDVGLHRGGFSNFESLKEGLQLIHQHSEHVTFSGFMGYDAHVPKLPAIVRSQEKALQLSNAFYQECCTMTQQAFPQLWHDQLTLNGAGSPTISLHSTDSPLNDISAGSCLIKSTSFDIPTLTDYKPACFIATPVLKKFDGVTIPAMEKFKKILSFLSAKNQHSYFIYGGYWKADYCYPIGIEQNKLFGASTNQTLLNAPSTAKLEVDDFVFLRPQQSEFVLLQFGNILVLRDGEIVEEWEVLRNDF